jgi:hypothetical protein
MTEEKLSNDGVVTKLRAKLPRWALILGAVFATLLLVVLLRTVIAGAWLHATCGAQKLTCKFNITRLDFGGLTIRDLSIVGADATKPPLRAQRIAVDLDWKSPWDVTARAVATEQVSLRLDLRDGRPLLGELEGLLRPYMEPKADPQRPKPPSPLPQLDLKTIEVVIETAAGPLTARGEMLATNATDFTLNMAVEPARVGYQGAEMDVRVGTLTARGAGGTIDGALKVDVARFKADAVSIDAARADVTFNQAGGAIRVHGVASANELSATEGGVKQAEATLDIESEAVTLDTLTLQRIITRIRRLQLAATAQEGSAMGAGWKSGSLTAHMEPQATGEAAGELKLTLGDITHGLGTAQRVDIDGDLIAATGAEDGSGRALRGQGTAHLIGAAIAGGPSRELRGLIFGMMGQIIPGFGEQADRIARSAAEQFEMTLPWSFKLDEGGFEMSALTGAGMRARNGFSATIQNAAAPEVFTFTQRGPAKWQAAGSLRIEGAGGPQINLDLVRASGEGARLQAEGGLELRPWRVGNDTMALKATGLKYVNAGGSGEASANVELTYDGDLAGARWTAASARGGMFATWTPVGLTADAPAGLVIDWRSARFGDTTLGQGALRYNPTGHIVEKRGEGIGGSGRIAGLDVPVTGPNFSGRGKLGATSISWTSAGATDITFDMDASSFNLIESGGPGLAVALADAKGQMRLADGWTLRGTFAGASAQAAAGGVRELGGAFRLAGGERGMSGDITNIAAHVYDPHEPAERAFEEALFSGSARIAGDVVSFQGGFKLAASQLPLGEVSGTHNLKTEAGQVRYAPKTFTFVPGVIQPSAISPLLRGPANVSGRVTVEAAASWAKGRDLATSAKIDLADLGFALAAAGIFEKVSGHVEVDDILKMTSRSGQTIRVGKVTLGMPIENGVIRFRLIGSEAIRLESAEWPFVGGTLSIQPLDFGFAATENRIVARASGWRLQDMVKLFDLKDIEAEGEVNGTFPVVFSTGSARLDKAELNATEQGGVLRYTGSAGAGAGSADANAKMLFDALKNFHFKVMQVTLDGDLAGQVRVGLNLLGRNPDVAGGAEFKLGLDINSPLMQLLSLQDLQTLSVGELVDQAVRDGNIARPNGAPQTPQPTPQASPQGAPR